MKEELKYKIYIDSSDRSLNKLILLKVDKDKDKDKEVEIERKEGQFDIVSEIKSMLEKHNLNLEDVEVFDYNKGPGSFTGLRVSAVISNTLNWILGRKEIKDLEYPKYGSEPNITPPKTFKLE